MDTLATFPVPPRTRFKRHEHPTVHACVVLAGGFRERTGGSWTDAGPGCVRVSAGARHDIDFGPMGARCLVLETAPETDTATPAITQLARPRFLRADPWLARLAQRIDRSAALPDAARAIVLDGLSAELLAQLARRLNEKSSPPPPWLDRVRDYVEDTKGMVTVAALAREAGVHRVHLARTFREHLGVPVTEYARRVRLAAAQRLLATSALPLSQVALQAGFADQSHLTRAMRAATGVTPAAVRRATLHPFKTHAQASR